MATDPAKRSGTALGRWLTQPPRVWHIAALGVICAITAYASSFPGGLRSLLFTGSIPWFLFATCAIWPGGFALLGIDYVAQAGGLREYASLSRSRLALVRGRGADHRDHSGLANRPTASLAVLAESCHVGSDRRSAAQGPDLSACGRGMRRAMALRGVQAVRRASGQLSGAPGGRLPGRARRVSDDGRVFPFWMGLSIRSGWPSRRGTNGLVRAGQWVVHVHIRKGVRRPIVGRGNGGYWAER